MTKRAAGSQPSKKTGNLTKAYMSAPIRGIMAGLPAFLGASGDPLLAIAGAGIGTVDAALAAHISILELNRRELSSRADARILQLREAGRLDESVLQSPDFHALVFQAAIATAQESESEKIEWYAAILAGAASRGRPEGLNVRAMLSSMTFLTAEEMRLARQFYEDFNQAGRAIVDGTPTPQWGPDTLLYLKRLESANLIVSQVIDALPARFQGTAGNYFVTSTFHRLMSLVRQAGEPQS